MSGTQIAYDATYSLPNVRYSYFVCRYTYAMQSPVLTSLMPLHACYAMSGTHIAYDATQSLCHV
eukprot:2452255-Rhodomonas_salina.1